MPGESYLEVLDMTPVLSNWSGQARGRSVGDGCFLMYPQELETAAEHGARLIALVVNNGIYGTIRMHQENTIRAG